MTCPVCGERPVYTVMGHVVHVCGDHGVFKGTPAEWEAYCAELERHMDAVDQAIIDARLAAIDENPARLVRGTALAQRLKALEKDA